LEIHRGTLSIRQFVEASAEGFGAERHFHLWITSVCQRTRVNESTADVYRYMSLIPEEMNQICPRRHPPRICCLFEQSNRQIQILLDTKAIQVAACEYLMSHKHSSVSGGSEESHGYVGFRHSAAAAWI
jgi:hypothetical protein